MIVGMKPLSFFLAFFIFWMSTWMVTDIHNIVADHAELSSSLVSIQQIAASNIEDHHIFEVEHDHQSHCGVCSYDHGGHSGATIVSLADITKSIPTKNLIVLSLDSSFWASKNPPPTLPPPIT